MRRSVCLMAAVGMTVCVNVSGGDERPWPADVPGFVKPKPGEHPRMLFRKSDIPALRKKAETPEGKAIIARLRHVLGDNGEKFPQKFSDAKVGYPRGKYQSLSIKERGYLTIGHAAGYGMLYQLTGEKKYADLGRQAFEKMMEGVRDVDSRYSFVAPNGELRAGSSWAVAALGYDLCYDGWDPEFRVNVAKKFLEVRLEHGTGDAGVKKVATNPKYDPAKNHAGGIIAGAAAAAALFDDPGTESEKIWDEWLPKSYAYTIKMLTEGFGDHGFYAESHGPSHVSSDTGFLVWLQSAKIACGKDFITPRPNAQWVSLRWVMEVVPNKGTPQYPDRPSTSSSYGTSDFWRTGWSHGGQFCQGFGTVEPKYIPAMLWTYENFIVPKELTGDMTNEKGDSDVFKEGWITKGDLSYDVFRFAWRAVVSFVNWPVGVKPENPERVMPKAVEDRVHGYYAFRNRWKDEHDILLTALLGYGPKSGYKPKAGPIMLWGLGKRYTFGFFTSAAPAEFVAGPNGGVVSTRTQCLGVDFSGASGSPALIVLAGIEGPGSDAVVKATPLDVGGQKIGILTMQTANPPEAKVDGDKITVGGQTVVWDGKKVVFAK